jgi:hypothetical protein
VGSSDRRGRGHGVTREGGGSIGGRYSLGEGGAQPGHDRHRGRGWSHASHGKPGPHGVAGEGEVAVFAREPPPAGEGGGSHAGLGGQGSTAGG